MQIENGSNMTFKRILLNKCQAEFEKEKTDEQQLEKEQDKHFENVRFILFLQMFSLEFRSDSDYLCKLYCINSSQLIQHVISIVLIYGICRNGRVLFSDFSGVIISIFVLSIFSSLKRFIFVYVLNIKTSHA